MIERVYFYLRRSIQTAGAMGRVYDVYVLAIRLRRAWEYISYKCISAPMGVFSERERMLFTPYRLAILLG